jgi:hypothetical protein
MALGGMEYGILFAFCCSCVLVLGLGGAGIWFFTQDRNKSKGVIDVAARPAAAPAARPPQPPPPAASARPAPQAAESAPTVVYSRKDIEQAKGVSESAKPASAADPQATMLHIPRPKPEAPPAEPPAAAPPSSMTIRDFKPASDPGATMLHLPSLDEPLEEAKQTAADAIVQADEALTAAPAAGEAKAEAAVEAGQTLVEAAKSEALATTEAVAHAAEPVETQVEEATAALDEVAASVTPAADDLKTMLHVPPPTPPAPAEPPAPPAAAGEADPLKAELSEAPTLRWPRNDEPTNTVSVASPNRAPDIREKLLGLNGPDKPYIVQESGFRITIAPTAITGYLLEISFDYITGTARLVETGPSDGGQIKAEAKQVLETNGWLAK